MSAQKGPELVDEDKKSRLLNNKGEQKLGENMFLDIKVRHGITFRSSPYT